MTAPQWPSRQRPNHERQSATKPRLPNESNKISGSRVRGGQVSTQDESQRVSGGSHPPAVRHAESLPIAGITPPPWQRSESSAQTTAQPSAELSADWPALTTADRHRTFQAKIDALSQFVERCQESATNENFKGAIDVDSLRQNNPKAVLQMLVSRANAKFGKGPTLPGVLVIANAYAELLRQRSNTATTRNKPREDSWLDTTTALVQSELSKRLSALNTEQAPPGPQNTAVRMLQTFVDAPSSLTQWLQAAGSSATIPTAVVNDGQHLRVEIATGVLFLPLNVSRVGNQSNPSAQENPDIGALMALLGSPVREADAHHLAHWLCTHAERVFTATPNADCKRAREVLHVAFRLCPSFDYETSRGHDAPTMATEQFATEAWNCCREVLLELAEKQTSISTFEEPRTQPSQGIFWKVLIQLCERSSPVWQSLLAELLQRVVLDPEVLTEQSRSNLSSLLSRLPIHAASQQQVKAVACWYAKTIQQESKQTALLKGAKSFIERATADDAGSRRDPLYAALALLANNTTPPEAMQALLDLFPSHDPFFGMPPTLAADLLMHTNEKYVRSHVSVFENILNVLLRGNCDGIHLCDKVTIPRWQTVLSLESLQPVSLAILQNEYAAGRPAPDIVSLLQQAVERGSDTTVTRKLEQAVSNLPASSTMYVWLSMALAQRSRHAKEKHLGAPKTSSKGRQTSKTNSDTERAKGLENSLTRLESVLSRCLNSDNVRNARVAVRSFDTRTPQTIDFLRQEMRAFANTDLSVAKKMGSFPSDESLRNWGAMLSSRLDDTWREFYTLASLTYHRNRFDVAEQLISTILQHLSRDGSQITPQEKATIEPTLRAWVVAAGENFKVLSRTLGADTFARSLQALRTSAPNIGLNVEARNKAVRSRLQALEGLRKSLNNASPKQKFAYCEQIAKALPQILSTMSSRDEHEAWADFWPDELSSVELSGADVRSLSLAYLTLTTSHDATHPQTKALIESVAHLLEITIAHSPSPLVIQGIRELLQQSVEDSGCLRAFKILLLGPQSLVPALTGADALRLLQEPNIKPLREHQAVLPVLTARILECSRISSWDSSISAEHNLFNEPERLALLQQRLDAVSFLRLIDLVDAGGVNKAAQTCLRKLVSSRDVNALRALTALGSKTSLNPEQNMYWSAGAALATVTRDATSLFLQVSAAFDATGENSDLPRQLLFLCTVLRQPVIADIKILTPELHTVLTARLGHWYGVLRTMAFSSRAKETRTVAKLWDMTGDLSNAHLLIEEILLQSHVGDAATLFDVNNLSLWTAVSAILGKNVDALAAGRADDAAEVHDATRLALRAAHFVFCRGSKPATVESKAARALFANQMATALAESSLIDNLAVADRPLLTRLIAELQTIKLGTRQSDTLARRLLRAWTEVPRNNETSKQLVAQMERFLAQALLNTDSDMMAISRNLIQDYLRQGQSNKAWRLIALLPDCHSLSSDVLRNLILESHVCTSQEMRPSLWKVLKAIPTDVAFPGLFESAASHKAPFSVLLRVPTALPWLAAHMHHIAQDASVLSNQWKSAVARLGPAERDAVLTKTLSEVPASGAMYLVAASLRLDELSDATLLFYMFDIAQQRRATDESHLSNDASSTQTFLRASLKRLSVTEIREPVELSEEHRATLGQVWDGLSALPVSERVHETEALAMIDMKLKNWPHAATHIRTLLELQDVQNLLPRPDRKRLDASARPRLWTWALDTLVGLREQEEQNPVAMHFYREAARRLIRSLPTGSADNALAIETHDFAARFAAQGGAIVDENEFNEFWGRVCTLGIYDAKVDVLAKPLALEALRNLSVPREKLSEVDMSRALLIAPALAVNVFRALLGAEPDVAESQAIEKAFAFVTLDAENFGFSMGATIRSVGARLSGPFAVLRTVHAWRQFFIDLTVSAVSHVAPARNAELTRQVAVNSLIAAYYFLWSSDKLHERGGLIDVAFLKSTLESENAALPAHDVEQIVRLARRLIDASEMEDLDVDLLSEARQGIVSMLSAITLNPHGRVAMLEMLLGNVDLCVGCVDEERQMLQQALERAFGQSDVRDFVADQVDRITKSLSGSATPRFTARAQHIAYVAPMIFDALVKNRKMSPSNVVRWLSFSLYGFIANNFSADPSKYQTAWQDLATRALRELDWSGYSVLETKVCSLVEPCMQLDVDAIATLSEELRQIWPQSAEL